MNKTHIALIPLIALLLSACEGGMTRAKATPPPFGGDQDLQYAAALWQQLNQEALVGKDSLASTPYTGTHPHGAILETVDGRITVSGHRGEVIVKKNYGGPGVSKQSVANDPGRFLKAVTVMFRRERGYDPDDQDWFWVKYGADGSVLTNPKGIKLAGRVAKGMNQGCIACHKAAPGGDMVYNHDRFAAH